MELTTQRPPEALTREVLITRWNMSLIGWCLRRGGSFHSENNVWRLAGKGRKEIEGRKRPCWLG